MAAESEAKARKLLGTDDVHVYHDPATTRHALRRPGVILRKLHGVKRKYEAWD